MEGTGVSNSEPVCTETVEPFFISARTLVTELRLKRSKTESPNRYFKERLNFSAEHFQKRASEAKLKLSTWHCAQEP